MKMNKKVRLLSWSFLLITLNSFVFGIGGLSPLNINIDANAKISVTSQRQQNRCQESSESVDSKERLVQLLPILTIVNPSFKRR